jgi:hypothetical protein
VAARTEASVNRRMKSSEVTWDEERRYKKKR